MSISPPSSPPGDPGTREAGPDVTDPVVIDDFDQATGPGRGRRYAAALLSAVVPGLGHLLYGRRRLAAVFLVPSVLVVAASAGVLLTADRAGLAARLVDPAVLAGALVAQLAVLAWRLAAVGSTLVVARPPRYRTLDALPVAFLAALVVLPQAYALAITNVARETALEVFDSSAAGPVWHPSAPPAPAAGPLASGGTAAPSSSPSPSEAPAPEDQRLTILLIGEDSGVGRRTALTDTMIVASLDPVGRTVSLLSIPRDLVDAPIPGGGTWHQKINSLAAWVRLHPDQFPGSNGVGQAVLAGVISELIGVPIDYWAQVNLAGLIRAVDTVGGVDVTVTHGFCDPGYDEYGQQGFGIPAGRWHLDGSQALAYSRVRKAAGESDFTRAARQQEVLAGLRDAVVRGGFLDDPIGFLQAIGQTVRTNVPPSLLPRIATFAGEIGRDRLFRDVITHPLVSASMDVRGYVLIPDIAGIRSLAAGLFPGPGVTPVVGSAAARPSENPGGGAAAGGGSAAGGPAGGPAAPTPTAEVSAPAGRAPNAPRLVCRAPAPAPTPTARPTPRPTASGGVTSPNPSSPGGPGTPEPTTGSALPSGQTPEPSPGLTTPPSAPNAVP